MIGRSVTCATCGRQKKPIGRDAAPAAANGYCDRESCEGYDQEPLPDRLWPGEGDEPTCQECEQPVTACACCPECDGTGGYLPAGACGGCEFCPAARKCGRCDGTGRL